MKIFTASFLRLQLLLQNPLLWYLAVSAFTVLYFFLGHEGFYFGDDYSYSLYAHQLLKGTFQFDDYVFCHRFMVFVPTAFFYWLWGMNVYTTTLWPLLSTLGTYSLLFSSTRTDHPTATSWALVLMGLFFFQLLSVNYLYPDNVLLFFVSACLFILYRIRFPIISLKKQVSWALAFAALNLMAFLTKETVVYALPFYLCLFIYQLARRENLWFWGVAFLIGSLFLAAYFYLYHHFTGNAFLRFLDIQNAGLADTPSAYLEQPFWAFLPRLTYGPILFFISCGLAIPLALAALYFLVPQKPRLKHLQHPLSFWAMATLAMLLPIWFGSVSLIYYKPMALLPRMFHPLLPAFCLLAGLSVEKAWGRKAAFALLAAFFGVSGFLAGGQMWIVYVPLALFFAAAFFWGQPVPQVVALLAVAAVLCIRPVYFILKPTVSYYFEQKEIVDRHLSHSKGQYVVLMDSTMLRRYPFFYGFEPPANYSFTSYAASDSALAVKPDTVFLLLNNGVLEHPELMISLREKDILPQFPTAQLLDQKGKVKLYFIPQ